MSSVSDVDVLEYELDMILRRIEASSARAEVQHQSRAEAARKHEDRWGFWKRGEESDDPVAEEDPELAAAKAAFHELSARIDAHIARVRAAAGDAELECVADFARAAAEKERLRQILLRRDAAARRYSMWLAQEAHLRFVRRAAVVAIVAVVATFRAEQEVRFQEFLASADYDPSTRIPTSPTQRARVLGELLEIRDLERRCARVLPRAV